jgi:spore coat polysaccharide biosynthesis protein SpsF (cytidylyltransferase family)
MAKVFIVTQARLKSTRLPEKILKEIQGKSLLQIHLESLKKSKYSKNLIVATTNEKGIEKVIRLLKCMSIKYYQGSTHDVLDRYYQAALSYKPDYIVRVTSDCPLIDGNLMDQVIDFAIIEEVDYVSNTLVENYPDGQDIEVISWSALKKAWEQSKCKFDREHVTPYIKKKSTFNGGDLFTSKNFSCQKDFNNTRMTLDEQDDYDAIKVLIKKLGFGRDWLTYAEFIKDNQSLFTNQNIIRNEGSKV